MCCISPTSNSNVWYFEGVNRLQTFIKQCVMIKGTSACPMDACKCPLSQNTRCNYTYDCVQCRNFAKLLQFLLRRPELLLHPSSASNPPSGPHKPNAHHHSSTCHSSARTVTAAAQLTAFVSTYKAAARRHGVTCNKAVLDIIELKLQEAKAVDKVCNRENNKPALKDQTQGQVNLNIWCKYPRPSASPQRSGDSSAIDVRQI